MNVNRQLLVSGIRVLLLIVVVVGALLFTFLRSGLPAGGVNFTQSAADLDSYDFVELSAHVAAARVRNPFTDASIVGTFQKGNQRWNVDGFSDAADGSVYRVRFMPQAAGDYAYSVELRQGLSRKNFTGKFHARASGRRGPIRVDPQNRWHFIWEGTGEHYFFNGTTAYWLIGWRDDHVIQSSIERLHQLKINRMRVTIAGRASSVLRRTGDGRNKLDTLYYRLAAAQDSAAPTTSTIRDSTTAAFKCLIGRSSSACCASPAIAT